MLHVGIFFHQLGVLVVVLDARQHELVFEHAIVANDEADLLAFADFDRFPE